MIMRARVVKPHDATDESQLTLLVGDVVYVLEQDESGWWGGHKEGEEQTGWFPGLCVCPTEEEGSMSSPMRSPTRSTRSLEQTPRVPSPTAPFETTIQLGRSNPVLGSAQLSCRSRSHIDTDPDAFKDIEHTSAIELQEEEIRRLRAELAELQRSSRQSDVELREQQRSLTKSEAAAEAEKKRTKDLYDELRVHQEKSARAETERQNLLAELHNERRNSQAAREAERSKAERAEELKRRFAAELEETRSATQQMRLLFEQRLQAQSTEFSNKMERMTMELQEKDEEIQRLRVALTTRPVVGGIGVRQPTLLPEAAVTTTRPSERGVVCRVSDENASRKPCADAQAEKPIRRERFASSERTFGSGRAANLPAALSVSNSGGGGLAVSRSVGDLNPGGQEGDPTEEAPPSGCVASKIGIFEKQRAGTPRPDGDDGALRRGGDVVPTPSKSQSRAPRNGRAPSPALSSGGDGWRGPAEGRRPPVVATDASRADVRHEPEDCLDSQAPLTLGMSPMRPFASEQPHSHARSSSQRASEHELSYGGRLLSTQCSERELPNDVSRELPRRRLFQSLRSEPEPFDATPSRHSGDQSMGMRSRHCDTAPGSPAPVSEQSWGQRASVKERLRQFQR